MTRLVHLVLLTSAVLLLPSASEGQRTQYPLDSVNGLRLHNVIAVPATLDGKKGLRLTMSEETAHLVDRMSPAERNQANLNWLAIVEGPNFSNGVIEVELAGAPAPGAFEGARGFVGIAFRVQSDNRTYDAFYLRPTNGRADDQERRNHAAQYVSPPEWPWFRLRQETPGKYESYADLVAGAWTKIKIEVRGERARLYVNGADQPTLIVNDVKSGPAATGAVALFLDPGTVAHFRNLTIERFAGTSPR
jgi:hypothetical protein